MPVFEKVVFWIGEEDNKHFSLKNQYLFNSTMISLRKKIKLLNGMQSDKG